jgi:hypothetical protein
MTTYNSIKLMKFETDADFIDHVNSVPLSQAVGKTLSQFRALINTAAPSGSVTYQAQELDVTQEIDCDPYGTGTLGIGYWNGSSFDANLFFDPGQVDVKFKALVHCTFTGFYMEPGYLVGGVYCPYDTSLTIPSFTPIMDGDGVIMATSGGDLTIPIIAKATKPTTTRTASISVAGSTVSEDLPFEVPISKILGITDGINIDPLTNYGISSSGPLTVNSIWNYDISVTLTPITGRQTIGGTYNGQTVVLNAYTTNNTILNQSIIIKMKYDNGAWVVTGSLKMPPDMSNWWTANFAEDVPLPTAEEVYIKL